MKSTGEAQWSQPRINVTSATTPQRRRPVSGGAAAADCRRACSPRVSGRLQVPDGRLSTAATAGDVWCEDEAELIRSCGALSRWLGIPRSFSTGDIARLRDECDETRTQRRALSEATLTAERLTDWTQRPLDKNSRSCSTWVAVGDLASTSQLQSPQGRLRVAGQSPFTTADLVLTVNKKMRHNYIRRRLHITFRALQRLSRNDFQLQQLFRGAAAAGLQLPSPPAAAQAAGKTEASGNPTAAAVAKSAQDPETKDGVQPPSIPRGISAVEVDRECGRPLTRYQRNILVFNWLQNLDPDRAPDS